MNPRAPKGHRLTVEPIPDMGPRARQTARYQAPESRLNTQPDGSEKNYESGDGSEPANNP